jgi:hypothetical protein
MTTVHNILITISHPAIIFEPATLYSRSGKSTSRHSWFPIKSQSGLPPEIQQPTDCFKSQTSIAAVVPGLLPRVPPFLLLPGSSSAYFLKILDSGAYLVSTN